MSSLTTIIPVYNGEKYIAETLQSVAQQTRPPDRLVVVDNCSTDRTREIVEAFAQMPCEWRQNEKNVGLFGNFNRALGFAGQTDYLHILHADDRVKPEFYERSVSVLESTAGRAIVFSQPEFIDEAGRIVSGPRMKMVRSPTTVTLHDFIVSRAELRPIYFPGIVIKTNRQPSPCQFRLDLPQVGDHVFWAQWAVHCSHIIQLPDVLSEYRFHPGTGTSGNTSNLDAWVLDEWKAMVLISELLGETGPLRWIRQQKLRYLFAARSRVKIAQVKDASPDYAKRIEQTARRNTSSLQWFLSGVIVQLCR